MKASGCTHVGKLRKRNEDAFVILENPLIAVVSDGMGGAPQGDVASRLTLQFFTSEVLAKETWSVETLHEAVVATNHAVVNEASKNTHTQGMGATLVAYLNNGIRAFLVNVGDSRAYGFNANGLMRLSEDHNVMNEYIKRNQNLSGTLDARFKHMLTSVIGMPAGCMADVSELNNDFDFILLCSDGLTNFVDDEEIMHIMTRQISIAQKVQYCIDAANQAGGLDNITVIIIDIRGNTHE